MLEVIGRSRVPSPPAITTAFITGASSFAVWTSRSIKPFQRDLYPEGIVRRTDGAWGFSQITSQTVDARPAAAPLTICRTCTA
ncbi:hypothetical protein GCM10018790_82140 [Kitasatospora xanthocidica]|nr:hypothetical protein GCM10018790_82140 [Kitasatospora xanthocidica]